MDERTEFEASGQSNVFARMPGGVQRAEAMLAAAGGLILFCTMAMTTIDVIGRYLFNSPLGFAYEITELLMATVVFVTLAAVTLRQEHITIGLFDHFWSPRGKALRDAVIGLVIVAATAFLSYRMFLFAVRFYEFGDITTMLKFPTFPVAALGAAGIGLTAVAGLALAADAVRRVRGGAP